MNFEDYLLDKKIDTNAFKSAEPDRWSEWNTIYLELSQASFTAQKLYLINPIRRKYPLKSLPLPSNLVESTGTDSSTPKPAIAKPVFKPKMN